MDRYVLCDSGWNPVHKGYALFDAAGRRLTSWSPLIGPKQGTSEWVSKDVIYDGAATVLMSADSTIVIPITSSMDMHPGDTANVIIDWPK